MFNVIVTVTTSSYQREAERWFILSTIYIYIYVCMYACSTKAYKTVSYNMTFILGTDGVRFCTGFNWLRKMFLGGLL
jgi:hypothetical protein